MFIRKKKLLKILNELAVDADKTSSVHEYNAGNYPRGAHGRYEAQLQAMLHRGRADAYDKVAIIINQGL